MVILRLLSGGVMPFVAHMRMPRLVTHSQFRYARKEPSAILKDSETVAYELPKVYPSARSIPPHEPYYSFPEICTFSVKDAVVYGGTNLVSSAGCVLCHDLFDPRRDFTSEELHARVFLAADNSVAFLTTTPNRDRIETAASFVDGCAGSYAHWLTEVFPRLALFCSEKRFADVPIIVDEYLHPNILQSIRLFAGQRKVIALNDSASLRVRELHLVSCAGYVPFEPRGEQTRDHPHGWFSPAALQLIRATCIDHAAHLGAHTGPKKIFIRRSSIRSLINADEIERFCVEQGFECVDPGQLSFLEQVRLFEAADVIVGASGAAMANIIFCRPSARIFILIADNPRMLYHYWQRVARCCSLEVRYILGDAVSDHLHSDFGIELCALADIIDLDDASHASN